MVVWLRNRLPDPEREADEHGLVALGGQLEPQLVLAAYRAGIFPWSSDPVLTWWSPSPRAIFDLATFKPHRSVRQSIRQNGWRFSINQNFVAVMMACGEPTEARPETWITDDFVRSYTELHRQGHAHSVEVFEGDRLVGGLYGVTVGGFFGGESMFHRKADASKAAVTFLVEHLRQQKFALCDAQVPTDHLMRLGAQTISRKEYLARLRQAIHLPVSFVPARVG